MTGHRGRAWIELDRTALASNLTLLRSQLPKGCELMPAVKANAYGHGACLIARELNRLGVQAFCVACADEGAALREAGVTGMILILGYTHPDQFPVLERCRLTQTIVDESYALLLQEYGERHKKDPAGTVFSVHLGLDTGMHRLGVPWEHLDQILAIFRMNRLRIDGIFTHLCASDLKTPEADALTRAQIGAFYQTLNALYQAGIPKVRHHLLSSYGALRYPAYGADYARIGIALYGTLSTKEDLEHCPLPLTPVLSLKARVASVRPIHRGETAGYDLAYTADCDRLVATLSIGYADGLPRALSCGVGYVLLHGRRAPILGKICMDQTLADVTGIPQTRPGDQAVLIGISGREQITVCDLAARAGTISNEILSRLGERLQRVLI